jgi:hypothetical protein
MYSKSISGVIIGVVLATMLGSTTSSFLRPQTSEAYYDSLSDYRTVRNAPIASSGENVYMAWSTNNTVNSNEVLVRSKVIVYQDIALILELLCCSFR